MNSHRKVELKPVSVAPASGVAGDGVQAGHAAMLRDWATRKDREAVLAEVHAYTDGLVKDSGRGMDLAEADLLNLDLRGFDLRGANFNRALLHGADLSDANLERCSLICTGMERTKFYRANLRGAYVHSLAAQVTFFDDADMRDLVDATGALFHGCSMKRVKLGRSALAGTSFYQTSLEDADLGAADLQGGLINECYLENTRFDGAQVAQLSMTKCYMRGASLRGVSGESFAILRPTQADGLDLRGASLRGLRLNQVKARHLLAEGLSAPLADVSQSRLRDADFSGAELQQSRWVNVDVDGANFSQSHMDGGQWQYCAASEADFSGMTCENYMAVECDFSRAIWVRISGRCASWRDCDLTECDLTEAYLYRAMITGDPPKAMSLRRARLHAANLVQSYIAADLSHADLTGAILVYARLNQSIFQESQLLGARLYGAGMIKTDCSGAGMEGVSGPMFADRCPGLADALKASEVETTQDLARFIDSLTNLLNAQKKGST